MASSGKRWDGVAVGSIPSWLTQVGTGVEVTGSGDPARSIAGNSLFRPRLAVARERRRWALALRLSSLWAARKASVAAPTTIETQCAHRSLTVSHHPSWLPPGAGGKLQFPIRLGGALSGNLCQGGCPELELTSSLSRHGRRDALHPEAPRSGGDLDVAGHRSRTEPGGP